MAVVGIPKEIKDGEGRVAITPAGVHMLTEAGHQVIVEAQAGTASGISDEEYAHEGAKIVPTGADVWQDAEVMVKVKEPLEQEYQFLESGKILFTYLHLASSYELTEALLTSGVTAVAYETIQGQDAALPLLQPMSEVAGRLAAHVGAECLWSRRGGSGILLGGVPGVAPAEVTVIGCGTAGLNAAKLARGMGAHVTVLDINHYRLKYIDDIMQGTFVTVYSEPLSIRKYAQQADLLICAVLIPGAPTPKLISREIVQSMHAGSVIVDIAIDQGGTVEDIRPTTLSNPTYIQDGVVHYAVPNIPALVPRTSTFALTNATIPYLVELANLGIEAACDQNPAIAAGVNIRQGEIVHPAVREAFPDLA